MSARQVALVVLVSTVAVPLGRAQCFAPTDAFAAGGLDRPIGVAAAQAQIVWDDGTGPALYIAGKFAVAGHAVADSIVKWDGVKFSALPGTNFGPESEGSTSTLYDLEVFDDGSGAALYACGSFQTVSGISAPLIAKWNGSSWSGVGATQANHPVGANAGALAVYDDGGGAKLYVAGAIDDPTPNSPFDKFAAWDGTQWTWLGAGALAYVYILDLEVFDLGAGPKLIAGLSQSSSGFLRTVAVWTGASFQQLGTFGSYDIAIALASYDDGNGPRLYAAGNMESYSTGVVRWNGAAWVSTGAPPWAYELAVFDDGAGPKLWTVADPAANQLLAYDGVSWTGAADLLDGTGTTLGVFDDGSGSSLYVGGSFNSAGALAADHVVRWRAGQWHALVPRGGKLNLSDALASFDDGTGTTIYRDTNTPGGDTLERWNGSTFEPFGGTIGGDIESLFAYDDGGGAKLYVGGAFNSLGGAPVAGIGRWNGSAWEALAGGGISGGLHEVNAMVAFDSQAGHRLVIAGDFGHIGDAPAQGIGMWDGASWDPMDYGLDGTIHCLAVYDSGSGPQLYAGGDFFHGSGNSTRKIARWDGAHWQAVGAGFNGRVNALAVYDDGSGPQLYAGGRFPDAGALAVGRLARWNGSAWSAVPGGGVDAEVHALRVFDDGFASRLIVGGHFTSRGPYLAQLDANGWSAFAGGVDGDVRNIATLTLPHGVRELWLDGDFTQLDGVVSQRTARWREGAPCSPQTYCTAKVNSQGCTPAIGWSGTPSLTANDFQTTASNLLNQKNGLCFWGYARAATPYQGGHLCVKSPLVRTPLQNSGGNAPPDDCSGTLTFPFSASYLASRGVVAGDRLFCQFWHRDPASAQPSGLTRGLSMLIEP